MATLDKMLWDSPALGHGFGEKQADAVKDIFKQWLKEVGLSDYYVEGLHDVTFNATESIRQLLIALVDEP